jgi:hypothetical protein
MEVCGQFQAPAALFPQKEPPVAGKTLAYQNYIYNEIEADSVPFITAFVGALHKFYAGQGECIQYQRHLHLQHRQH